jgi:hypothetical protein
MMLEAGRQRNPKRTNTRVGAKLEANQSEDRVKTKEFCIRPRTFMVNSLTPDFAGPFPSKQKDY